MLILMFCGLKVVPSAMNKLTVTPDHSKRSSYSISRTSLIRMKSALSCCIDDPRTVAGRRKQLSKVIGLAAIPIILLVIRSAYNMNEALLERSYTRHFEEEFAFSAQVGNVIHALGTERGAIAYYLVSRLDIMPKFINDTYRVVDGALSALSVWPKANSNKPFFASRSELESSLNTNRQGYVHSAPEQQLRYYTDVISSILQWIGEAVTRSEANKQYWKNLVAYHLFISAKEKFAVERSIGSMYFAQGFMSYDMYMWYQEQRIQGKGYLAQSISYNPNIQTHLEQHFYNTETDLNITQMRNIINHNNTLNLTSPAGGVWYRPMTVMQNVLHDIENLLIHNITENLKLTTNQAVATMSAEICILVLSVILIPTITAFLYYLTGQIQSFANVLQNKNDEIVKEKRRADAILYQLLPRPTAEKLKQRMPVFPESFETVTIFFSDIVEFTNLSATCTPMEVIDTLNRLYTVMDTTIEAYDVYKVETIGDAYLCASGLPERNGNKHVYEIAAMSLDLLNDIQAMRLPHKPDYSLRIRIGVHTGSCAAGVIGTKMPRYCIFGDTVNTASRMESHGEPCRIQISSVTNDFLTTFGIFHTELRGDIQIKGKGLMRTYWLLRKILPEGYRASMVPPDNLDNSL